MQKSYTTNKTLPIIKQVEYINKKKFAKIALEKNIKLFITSLNLSLILIYLAKKIQIDLLITKKIKILNKYLDFAIFSQKKKFQYY